MVRRVGAMSPAGMGVPTITATRILKGQLQGKLGPETPLVMDTFPYVALSKVPPGGAQQGAAYSPWRRSSQPAPERLPELGKGTWLAPASRAEFPSPAGWCREGSARLPGQRGHCWGSALQGWSRGDPGKDASCRR